MSKRKQKISTRPGALNFVTFPKGTSCPNPIPGQPSIIIGEQSLMPPDAVRAYLSQIGQRGGKSRSPAKLAAARTNACKKRGKRSKKGG